MRCKKEAHDWANSHLSEQGVTDPCPGLLAVIALRQSLKVWLRLPACCPFRHQTSSGQKLRAVTEGLLNPHALLCSAFGGLCNAVLLCCHID